MAAQAPADNTCFGSDDTEQRASSSDEPSGSGCPDACCDGLDTKALDNAIAGNRCGSKPAEEVCQQGCCGADKKASDEATVGGYQHGCGDKPKGNPSCSKDKMSLSGVSAGYDVSGGACSKGKAPQPCQQTEASCCEAKADKEAHNTKPAESTPSLWGDNSFPSTLEPAEADCNKRCCSEPTPPKAEDPNHPSCCEGKTPPCCDVSCLDRIALRECDVSSGTSPQIAKMAVRD